jgi:ribosome-binding protein aMBF1 (putative translation factor)
MADSNIKHRRTAFSHLRQDVQRIMRTAVAEAGLTTADLAARLGITDAVVDRMLSEPRTVSLETLCDLAWAMDRRIVISLEVME